MSRRIIRKTYVDYDVEESINEALDALDEDAKIRALNSGITKWIYAEKTVTSGKIKEIEIYPEFTRTQISKQKEIKEKKKRWQKNLNDKNARKYLQRLINANFGDHDIWMTLTYDDEHMPDSIERAQKNMNYYFKKVNRRRKKKGLNNAKYVYVTECSSRLHHHVIIDGELSMDELEEMWPYGRRNNTRRISKSSDDLTGLARYLAKDPKGKKRWSSSRNLKKPEVRKNHQITMRRISKIAEDDEMLKSHVKKKYPKAEFFEVRRCINSFNGLFYFYVRFKE